MEDTASADASTERERSTNESDVEIAARIYQSMAVSNCSSEQSFSCSKRIKTYLRSSMREPRLNDLAILCIEPDTVESISFDGVIEDFCDREAPRKI